MEKIKSGIFKVSDGEVITITVRSTGAQTLFGVNLSGEDKQLKEGEPRKVTMKKDQSQEDSTLIAGAKFTSLTLLFSFNTDTDGRYDWTMTGSKGGDPVNSFVIQAGGGPESVTYDFHIV